MTKRLEYKGLPYRVQVLPGPAEIQVIQCPWCGELCDVEDADLDDYFDEVDSDNGFYTHKNCGKLVRLLSVEGLG